MADVLSEEVEMVFLRLAVLALKTLVSPGQLKKHGGNGKF